MLTPKSIGLFATIVFGIVVIFLFRQPEPESSPAGSERVEVRREATPEPTRPATSSTNAPPTEAEGVRNLASRDSRFSQLPDGSHYYIAAVARSQQLGTSAEPGDDLELIADLLGDYRLFFKSNPVGSENYEIVEQLLGANDKQISFLDREITSLAPDGLLLDRWGTPYTFHPLTSSVMDIRSAGPDQELWTDDDLSLDVSAVEEELQLYPDAG